MGLVTKSRRSRPTHGLEHDFYSAIPLCEDSSKVLPLFLPLSDSAARVTGKDFFDSTRELLDPQSRGGGPCVRDARLISLLDQELDWG